MRENEYKAKDKKVKKISRDGLVEENLHSKESVRISKRELDSLTLPGQAEDSVNFQNIRNHRKTGKEKRRHRYTRDFKKPESADVSSVSSGLEEKDIPNEDCSFLIERRQQSAETRTQTIKEKQTKNVFLESSAHHLYDEDRKIPENRNEGMKQDEPAKISEGQREYSLRTESVRGHPDSRNRLVKSAEETGHNRKKRQVQNHFQKEQRREEKRQKTAEPPDMSTFRDEIKTKSKREQLYKEQQKKNLWISFGREENGMVHGAGMGVAKAASVIADNTAGFIDKEGDEEEQENTSVEIVYKTGLAAKSVVKNAIHSSSRGRQRESSHRWDSSVETFPKSRLQFETAEKYTAEEVQEKKRAFMKLWQKQKIKKSYQTAKRSGKMASKYTGTVQTIFQKLKSVAGNVIRKNKGFLVTGAVVGLLLVILSAGLTSCSAMLQGVSSSVIGTTYPSDDADIYAVDADYAALENALNRQINNMESTHPGYDEYQYQVDEISHNPYQLMSYLTVMYQEFTYDQIKDMLQGLFSEQYQLTVTEIVETRTRTITNEETEEEEEEEYECHILCISLTNYGFDTVARNHLTAEQAEHYAYYNTTYGNRNYLFDIASIPVNGGTGDYSYDIPEEALSDDQFANMIHEAEKYLGYPYVWGGASPSTSFDCSGYVSWVINNCGNGWNVGRSTAEGLRNQCAYVSPSEARPGDLIFFQGTYNTSGASHVGIYAGNNMMIHCGNPIQYTNIGSAYWQQHFLSYGRIQ